MAEMIEEISTYPNGTYLKIIWDYGKTVIEGVLDTVYETDNGLDEEEEGYQEFYACAIMVQKIIRNLGEKKIAVNHLIEISKENKPTSIELKDGTIIWKN